MKNLKYIILWLGLATAGMAQELNVTVQVNASQIQTSDRRIYETLQSSMFEFMNGRRWSDLNFAPNERIECNFTLVVQKHDLSSKQISGSLSVQVRRPIFNSTYYSVLLNLMDKDVSFQYAEYDPLQYVDGAFHNNLTSVLAYYANVILGVTFDSFGKNYGAPFFQKSMEIAMRCQDISALEKAGWETVTSRKLPENRYWLVDGFTNSSLQDLHSIYYTYHRQELDQMYENPEKARQAILESLETLQKVNKIKSNLMFKQVFFEAKSDELINIFKMGTTDEKNKLITLMRELNPVNMTKYQTIMN